MVVDAPEGSHWQAAVFDVDSIFHSPISPPFPGDFDQGSWKGYSGSGACCRLWEKKLVHREVTVRAR